MNDIVYIVTEESTWKEHTIFSTEGEIVRGIFDTHEDAVGKIDYLMGTPLFKQFRNEFKWTDADTAEIHDNQADIVFRIHEHEW